VALFEVVDFGSLFTQMLSNYRWAVPLLIFVVLLKSVLFKGFIGEVMANLSARLFLDENNYHLIKCQRVKPGTAEKNEPVKSPAIKLCPKYGCEMKLHTARKVREAGNQFWGCSAFPKCRTTATVER